jgi:Na+/H+ antiporter NhaD/arsenite permease-like protein
VNALHAGVNAGADETAPVSQSCPGSGRRITQAVAGFVLTLAAPSLALAAPAGEPSLGLVWAIPFAGLLLSIALLPLVAASLWHHHFGKVALFWAAAFAIPFAATRGPEAALAMIAHAMLVDYVPFIVLLVALYTVSGGIRVTGRLRGTPGVNTLLLAIGTALASVTGTTGAAMLLVRPLIRANRGRRHTTHVFVFFIFLVANIGGALSPLGDPPLFIGFLEGVPFFWPTVHHFLPTVVASTILLCVFHVLDRRLHRRHGLPEPSPVAEIEKLGLEGNINLLLLVAVVGTVVMSGVWNPGVFLGRSGIGLDLQQAIAVLLLLVITAASLRWTKTAVRERNEFGWEPMAEVAILFAAIFVTIAPMLEIVRAGERGPAAILVRILGDAATPQNHAYFWLTGLLSAFLDNAPTYLVFFNFAGGDPAALTGPLTRTLAAISCGAVFFGASTYIGNAPNLMVKAVAERNGIRMPGFFGYFGWSAVVLGPVFAIVGLLFF